MKQRSPATGFRLFLKSFFISLLIIIPIYMVLYFTLLNPSSEGESVGSNYGQLPVYARSQNILLAVCGEDSLPLFAAAIRLDVEENSISVCVIPPSALPETDMSVIYSGGTPSAYMELCVSELSQQYKLAFNGYLALRLSSIENMVDELGRFRHNVTVPITSLGEGGLAEFRLERGFQLLNGGSAAGILWYCRTLPEQQYADIVGRLFESALSEYFSPDFSERAVNALYSVLDNSATDIGAQLTNQLLNAGSAICQNGGKARIVQLPGSYDTGRFEPSGTLTDYFS